MADFQSVFSEFGVSMDGAWGMHGSVFDCDEDYDPFEDPEYIDEDEDVKGILRQIYKGGAGGDVDEMPVDMPFYTNSMDRPNIWYDKVGTLMDNSELIREMVQEIKVVGEKHLTGGVLGDEYDFQRIAEEVQHLRPQFEKIINDFLNEKETPGVMPGRPDSAVIYSRIEEQKGVYDVGCGNGSKLVKRKGTVRGCDPEATGNFYKGTFLQALEDGEGPLPSEVVTTFNVITQLPPDEQKMLDEYTGVHLLPDIDYLVKVGVAKADGDVFCSKDAKGCTWRDNECALSGGMPLIPGYLGLNTYAQSKLHVLGPGQDKVLGSFSTMTKPGVFDCDVGDLTHKLDGEMVKMECDGNRFAIRNRAGKAKMWEVHSGNRFSLLAEKVQCGMVWFFFVIRILYFDGFVPFHGGAGLRKFVDRNDIVVDGIRLVCPPEYDESAVLLDDKGWYVPYGDAGDRLPVDGVICRGDTDVYRKFVWTVDLYGANVDRIVEKIEQKYNIEVHVDSVCDGLWEYSLDIRDNGIRVSPVRHRKDKKIANELQHILETVGYALSQ